MRRLVTAKKKKKGKGHFDEQVNKDVKLRLPKRKKKKKHTHFVRKADAQGSRRRCAFCTSGLHPRVTLSTGSRSYIYIYILFMNDDESKKTLVGETGLTNVQQPGEEKQKKKKETLL